jgi:hypothetical protein
MRCPTCNHDNGEDAVHKLGACKQCNCGESEIQRFHTTSIYRYSPYDYSNNIHAWAERLAYHAKPQTRFRSGGGR